MSVSGYSLLQLRRLNSAIYADVIYDPVGLIKDSLKCIAWKGRLVVVGFAAGAIEKVEFIPIDVLSGQPLTLSVRFL